MTREEFCEAAQKGIDKANAFKDDICKGLSLIDCVKNSTFTACEMQLIMFLDKSPRLSAEFEVASYRKSLTRTIQSRLKHEI